MTNHPDIPDFWSDFRASLPAGLDLEASARAHGALTRVREVKSGEDLLRLCLAYGGCGMSLRQTCAWAEATGVARLSDPALLERLCKAGPWLGAIVAALLSDRAGLSTGRLGGRRLRALDATTLCEPGADRTSWRLHVGHDLASGLIDHVTLTDGHGAESLRRLPWRQGDIALADRGYARPRDLRPVIEAGADVIVRTGWNSLRLLRPEDGAPFDLFATLAAWSGEEGEVMVRIDEGIAGPAPLILRLVVRRKTEEHAEQARARIRQEARKRSRTPDPRSLEAAGWILLLTSLPRQEVEARDVLALYRLRWQIELAFKRLKSLAGLDQLPARNHALARAWIFAKLIMALSAERDAGQVPDSSPSGPARRTEPIALAPRATGPRRHQSRHPRAALLENPRQGPRNHATTPP